ncbi:MAG: FMN-binding protein [Spirochaetia bacterium]|jgi:electron transport complex protein RnfG|nr:FMN-binding protein [Spirochaetia bacterium]
MSAGIIKPSLILTVTAFVAAFALSHVNKITAPAIARQTADREREALSVVLPGFAAGNEKTDGSGDNAFRYWEGEKNVDDAAVKAYAFITSSPGYSGDVKSMVGVDSEGKILGIYIIEQSETPGLGARAAEIASSRTIWDIGKILSGKLKEEKTHPWFQRQFAGLSAGEKIKIEKAGDWTPAKEQALLEKNAITAITGATITGRAVIAGIEKGYERLRYVLGREAAQ